MAKQTRETRILVKRMREALDAARTPLLRGAAGALSALPALALANPSGGQVVAGNANISNPSANGTVINQGSQNAVINWQQFSVGSGQYVQFIQPNSSAVVLNRVVGGTPSSIFGDIKANGQVFLVNPNGIFFAPGSTLDAQGILASTLDIKDSDFMAGRYLFQKGTGAPDATVVNQGSLTAGSHGYVVLAGDYVENDGRIDAQLGRVYLAAGGSATLTLQGRQLISYVVDGATLARLAGVDNAGAITANGGGVVMTADVANALTATAVNNSGFVAAHSVRQGEGVIVLAATGGEVENSGTLDASAAAWAPGIAGGTVLIRGAGDTRLDPSSVIDTGGNGAPGGTIEVSGHDLSIHGQLNAGRGGNLLLDPTTITIESSGTANAANCSGCEGGIIHTNFIDHELNAGIDLTIIASNQIIIGSGNHSAGPATNITAHGGSGNLALRIGHASGTIGGSLHRITSSIFNNQGSLQQHFVPTSHGIISLAGLTISINGKFLASASLGAVTLGNVTAKAINVTGNNLTVGNLTATGAAGTTGIFLTASHSGSATQINTKTLKTTGGGDITVLTRGNGDQNISISGSVNAKGNFKASAQAVGSGANGADVTITGNVLAKSITIVGSAGGGGGNIQTKSLHANGGATTDNISVHGAAGAVAFSSGHVLVTGTVTADHGDVTLSGQGGGDSAGGGVTVTGAINAAGAVGITGDYIGSSKGDGGGRVQLGNVTGKSVSITAFSTNPIINVGNVTATGAAGSLHIFGSGVGSGVGSRAAIISAGSLTATNGHGQVNVNLSHVNAAAGIKLGAINAPLIGVFLDGNGDIVTGALTAVSTAARANINISAFNGAAGAANHVIINGNITAQGKTPPVTGGFSSGPFSGVPVAAGVGLDASGSCTGCAHDVKVSGNVVITANGRHFTHTSHNESGPTTIVTSGSGGVANFVVMGAGAAGSADVTGAVTVTGPEAAAAVLAKTVQVHNVTVTGQGQNLSRTVTVAAKVTFTSTNSAGDAFVQLGGLSGSHGGPTQTVTAGNITVSGKGFAAAGLFASHVTAGNVAATATAAKGSIAGGSNGSSSGQGNLFSGLANGRLDNGTITAGIAEVAVGKNATSLGSHGSPALSVNLGAVTATGVGRANITLAGQKVNTKALTAIATKGLEAGSGSTLTGSVAVNKTTHKFNVNGGEAGVDIDTGSGSGTSINVAGNVSASGPTAGVRLKGGRVKVSGNVSAVGTGGALMSDTVFKPAAGTGFHVHFVGPGSMDAVSLGNSSGAGSVDISGTVSVKGQGIVGLQVTAAKVNLGGLSASASAAAAYIILDTRKSATADVFTAGSLAVFVIGTNGSNTAPAVINGAVNINAPHGNVALATNLHVSGQINITAGSSITTDLSKVGPRISEISNAIGRGSASFSSGGTPPFTATAAGAKLKAGGNVLLGSAAMNVGGGALSISAARSVVLGSANLAAGKVTVVAGSSIDLTGATAKVSGEMELAANKNIILTGVNLNVGVLDATASGSILDGGTTGGIVAGGLALVAGKNIAMQSTAITVGNGTVPGISGDANLLLGLTLAGIAPGAPAPNATFIAGGNLTLGDFTLTGSYLYLQAANITFLGNVTVPKGTLVQISPINPAATIGVEDQPASGSDFNLSNSLDLSLFAGDTIAIGNGLQTGDVTLGNNGTINIGDTNLIIDTSGNITGLENVISTGIVTSLASLLGPPVPPPTSGEIDPNSSNNNNTSGGKKQQGVSGEDTGTGQQGGTISQDTGNSSVCR